MTTPWWADGAADWLHTKIKATDEIFEWGSGGSTLWLAQRAAKVTTVEHDPKWARKVQGIDNVSVVEIDYQSNPEEYIGACNRIEKWDVIVIDGRMRRDCIPVACRNIKDGGLLVFDDIDRARYHNFLPLVSGMKSHLWIEHLGKRKRQARITSIFEWNVST